MTAENEIVIHLSKRKMALNLFGALAFVGLGSWFLIEADEMGRYDPLFIRAVGIASISFFGLGAVLLGRKLFDRAPGLIINSQGIFDNSSGIATGLIPWEQIIRISVHRVQSQRFLTIEVRDPRPYLKQGNFLKRLARKANNRYFASPVQISATSLDTDFDELLAVTQQYLQKYRSP